MDIKCLVDCEDMSLSTNGSNFIALENDGMIGSFVSKANKVSFNKDTEVFNYEKKSKSNTYTSDLNYFNIMQVSFDETLDKEHLSNSAFGKSIKIGDNTATCSRRLPRKMTNST